MKLISKKNWKLLLSLSLLAAACTTHLHPVLWKIYYIVTKSDILREKFIFILSSLQANFFIMSKIRKVNLPRSCDDIKIQASAALLKERAKSWSNLWASEEETHEIKAPRCICTCVGRTSWNRLMGRKNIANGWGTNVVDNWDIFEVWACRLSFASSAVSFSWWTLTAYG